MEHLLHDLARAVPDAAVLAGLSLALHRQPPAHHVQRVCRAHAHNPAPAPAARRSSGVICPSPPLSCRWCDMRLHRGVPGVDTLSEHKRVAQTRVCRAQARQARGADLLSCSYVRNFTAELGTIRTTFVQFPAE